MTARVTTSRSRGFTLLELIVAMAMVSILAGSLYACIYIGFKSRETAQRAILPAQRMGNVLTMLALDIDGALPPTGIFAAEFRGFSGSGGTSNSQAPSSTSSLSAANLNSASSSNLHVASLDPEALTLLSFFTSSNTPRENEFGADVRKVEFTLETPERSAHPALVRRVYTNLSPSKEPLAREQILCRNVISAYMRFFDGTVWLDTWDSKAQADLLPLAVEMTLEMELPDDRVPQSEWTIYKMTRVFRVPCAAIADSAAATSGLSGTADSPSGGGSR